MALHANLPAARSVSAASVCSMGTSLIALKRIHMAQGGLHVAGWLTVRVAEAVGGGSDHAKECRQAHRAS